MDFYRKVSNVRVTKVKGVEHEDAIRVYGSVAAGWTLQVRGHLHLADGRAGKDFVIASASYLKVEDLRALHQAAGELLAECVSEVSPAPEPEAREAPTPAPAATGAPTLLGLAALASAAGLDMLSDQLRRAHDVGPGLHVGDEVQPPAAWRALQVITEAENIWSDAARHGAECGADARNGVADARRLLAVARRQLKAVIMGVR